MKLDCVKREDGEESVCWRQVIGLKSLHVDFRGHSNIRISRIKSYFLTFELKKLIHL